MKIHACCFIEEETIFIETRDGFATADYNPNRITEMSSLKFIYLLFFYYKIYDYINILWKYYYYKIKIGWPTVGEFLKEIPVFPYRKKSPI